MWHGQHFHVDSTAKLTSMEYLYELCEADRDLRCVLDLAPRRKLIKVSYFCQEKQTPTLAITSGN